MLIYEEGKADDRFAVMCRFHRTVGTTMSDEGPYAVVLQYSALRHGSLQVNMFPEVFGEALPLGFAQRPQHSDIVEHPQPFCQFVPLCGLKHG